MNTVFQLIPVEWLQPGRFQPRRNFCEKALHELAESILTQGLIEPLIVRALAFQQYEIIAGERRWRAALLAGLSTVPCLLSEYTDAQAAAITLIENIQREDLNLVEEATGYQRLIAEFHFQQDEVAGLVGKSRSHIANLLRLLQLNDTVLEYLRKGHLSLGHARMLVGLAVPKQKEMAFQCIKEGWSVREFEKRIRALKSDEDKILEKPSRDVLRLEEQLSEQMGAPVKISNEEGASGWLKVKFYDNDTLAGLLDKMGLRYD
ncbi:MAG: ParB/RepB/Spo0J family partition protein [Tatlockia sp.]|jgi:ParB family chromosome partitioning protein